jgi:hypothetical protein
MWEWDEGEYEDLSRTKPKYSTILQHEEYEDEDAPTGFDRGPEANYDQAGLATWDPWEPSYFFPIK